MWKLCLEIILDAIWSRKNILCIKAQSKKKHHNLNALFYLFIYLQGDQKKQTETEALIKIFLNKKNCSKIETELKWTSLVTRQALREGKTIVSHPIL